MDADEALHALFLRKMNAISGDDEDSVKDLNDFYTRNERKLIGLCKRHIDDPAYKRLRNFVTFEFNLRREPIEEPPKPAKMTMVHAGEDVETKGNPDGILTHPKDKTD
jgi:hypothetical protein